MARVKRGTTANKRRKNIIKKAKGYSKSRSSKFRSAKQAVIWAGKKAYIGRKARKRDFRSLWQLRISNAVKPEGLNYSKFMNALKKAKIGLNRKMLSELAVNEPKAFKKIVEETKKVIK